MRSPGAYIAGVLTGLSLLLLHTILSRAPHALPPDEGAGSGSLEASGGEAPPERAGPAARRVGGPAPGGPSPGEPSVEGAPLPDAAALGKLLAPMDLPAFRGEVERLLGAGEPGYRTILDFLRAQAAPPKRSLRRDGPLGPLLLSVALRNEERAADCCRFLLGHLDPDQDAEARGHLLRFLPVFVACAGGAGPEVRRVFEEALLADLTRRVGEGQAGQGPGKEAQGDGAYALRSLAALDELGAAISAEDLETILSDPAKGSLHPSILQRLAARGDDASIDVIIRHLERIDAVDRRRFGEAFQALAGAESPKAQAIIEDGLSSPIDAVRLAAALAYFSARRGADSLPHARAFIASGADPEEKAALVWRIHASSPEVFAALEKDLASLPPEVGKAVQIAAVRGGAGSPASAPKGRPPGAARRSAGATTRGE